MRYLIVFFFTIGISNQLICQIDYGRFWALGTMDGLWDTTSTQGVFLMDFEQSPVQMTNLGKVTYRHDFVSAAICDNSNDLLFVTAGISILNKDFNPIKNSFALPADDMAYDKVYLVPQGLFFLPFSGHIDSTILFYSDVLMFEDPISMSGSAGTYNLTWSIIDHLGNSGRGEVVKRLEPLIAYDTMSLGQLTATRHANGRDWWILAGKALHNEYYRFLLCPEGVKSYGIQKLETPIQIGLGQAVFSADGTFYARYNAQNNTTGSNVDIYTFDRCTGDLAHIFSEKVDSIAKPGGIAFSPNSQYVYVSSWDSIYQYDVLTNDIAASKTVVAVYDGYNTILFPNDSIPSYRPTRFFLMQAANDGKIYISVPNYTSNVLHTIESPNEKGLACNVAQHSFHWPKIHTYGLPNMPNYALGALEGSPCDTLGLSNTQLILPQQTKIQLYPNPASTNLTVDLREVEITKNMQIEFFDLFGRLMKSYQLEKTPQSFDISDLDSGMYFYKIHFVDRNEILMNTFSVIRN